MNLGRRYNTDQAILHACICTAGCTLVQGHLDAAELPDTVAGDYLKYVMIADVPATIAFIGPYSTVRQLASCG